jgi:uncharacterized cupredoxin-like copper-binding protein/Cu/Ag efflux protein CusF
MKRLIIACVLAMSLAFATGALGHSDENHGKKEDRSADGHAADLGRPGDPENVTRSIEVAMNDAMRFLPDSISVKRGETIRFLVRNVGKLRHEMVLGTIEEMKEHAELMRKFPEMEHDDPNLVSVEPGKAGELIWQFTDAGTFDFACLQPGHFEAGMVGKVLVGSVTEAETTEGGKSRTAGLVRKVDKVAGKVTIRHEPIENLGMPKMTMIFRVRDPAMLDRLKEGDRILFIADKVNGAFTVMQFDPAE